MKRTITLFILSLAFLALKAQPFYSEDFSGGLPVGWTNIDNSGNNILWRVTTTGASNGGVPVDTLLNSSNTTAANGYLIFDSDSAGQGLVEDAVLTSTAINCSAHASVHLTFNEYFVQYLTSTGTVSVSNDNLNWTDVHLAHNGLSLNQGTLNPNAVDVDITGVAGGQTTVYIRFFYHGEWDYWWFVDDVNLYEPSATDLAAISISELSSQYTSIPLRQATTLNLSAEIKNNGLTTTNGGTALLELVDAGSALTVFSEQVNLSSLTPGGSQVVVPTSSFTPPAAGNYKGRVTVTIPGDGNPINDQLESGIIVISDSVYARDNGNMVSTLGIGAGPGEDGIEGQNFLVNNPGDLSSVTFFFDDTLGFNPAGTPVYFSVHAQLNDTTPPDSVVMAYTDTMIFYPGTIPQGGAFYALHISGGPLHVLQGLYFIGLHEVDSLLPIGYTSSILTQGAVWVHWNSIPSATGWARPEDFGFQLTYMIRANFVPSSVNTDFANLHQEIIIFPNPSVGIINLRYENPNKDHISIAVLDALGQVVYNEQSQDSSSTLRMDLPAGIYFIRLSSSAGSICKKIILAGD